MKVLSVREIGIGLKNVLLGGSLASLSLARTPRKWAIYVTESLAMLDAIRDKKGLRLRNVYDVLGDSGPVTITLWNAWMGPIAGRTADIVSLCILCQLASPKVVFEIGTGRGCTALHIVLNTPDDAEVYTLDLPLRSRAGRLRTTTHDRILIDQHAEVGDYLFTNTPVGHKIRCLFGDSAIFDFSPFYGTVDLFFIDGAHSYEYVRSDTINALKCCHSGSVIAWHDFGRHGINGVTPLLRELSRQMSIHAIPGGSLAFAVVEHPAKVVRGL